MKFKLGDVVVVNVSKRNPMCSFNHLVGVIVAVYDTRATRAPCRIYDVNLPFGGTNAYTTLLFNENELEKHESKI